ncbi:SDR family NAD(P)-dependent oxidoreductase [Gordonia sp. (in: high G+C Gram-positive bacteria)]|uniref:SDR family NAD(P)-dependent oxidoreductase n=1 Tax=Gordonia sp. (in: high G+C Gram-positive bacteria) TaxID=84139 RepID=UPI003F9AE4EE
MIVADGGSAVAVRVDISEADHAQSLIDGTTARLGAPSVLVNNAGMNKTRSARKQTIAEWDQVIAVNLSGPSPARTPRFQRCTRMASIASSSSAWPSRSRSRSRDAGSP